MKEKCELYHEVIFNQQLKVNIYFSDLDKNNNKYLCHGLMYNAEGIKMAEWESLYGVFNRVARKIESMTDNVCLLLAKFCG